MARPIDDIAQAITQAIIDALKDREDELKSVAEAGGNRAGHGIFGDVKTLTGILSDIITAVPIVGELLGLPLEPIKIIENAAGGSGRGFGLGYFLGYAGWQFAQPALRTYTQDMERMFHSLPLDPAQAADLVARHLYTEAEGRQEAEASGLDGHKSDLLIDAARTRPDVVTALTMRNRDLISDELLTVALQRHGYPDDWIGPLVALRRQLLSPADLALAQLRGNVSDDVARAYAQQLGVTDDDFTVLIGNTGEPPGVMQMLEMFRRDFITEDQLTKGIRESRVRNEWIEPVKRLRFEPMTTADAARAVVENYMTDEQGAAIAQLNGLEPDHWHFIVESWGRPLSHEQMMTLYHRRQVTLDEVHQAFRESDLKDKYIDAAVELGRELIPQRTIVSMIDHAVIDRATGVELLLLHGYTREDADRLVSLGAAQRTTSHRTLSKTDILAMYTDALMNRQQASDHLVKLGYSREDASEMLDLAEYKRKAATLKVIERGIQASLKAHHITAEQAMSELTHQGLDHAQAQILVDEWLQERKVASRSLTEKQIIDAVYAKFIEPAGAVSRLRVMGFGADDIRVIFRLNGLDDNGNPPPVTTS